MAESSPESPSGRARLVVPELGLDAPLAVCLWLVPQGTAVIEGDRVVQLVAGGVTVDLEAPITGRLTTCLVEEDEPVAAGAVLAEFDAVQRGDA